MKGDPRPGYTVIPPTVQPEKSKKHTKTNKNNLGTSMKNQAKTKNIPRKTLINALPRVICPARQTENSRLSLIIIASFESTFDSLATAAAHLSAIVGIALWTARFTFRVTLG